MITVGMNYAVLDGKQAHFEKMFAKVLVALNESDGHTRSALYRDVNDATAYLIISEWGDESAFQAFMRSERFRNVADWGREQILRSRPAHTVYRNAPSADRPETT